MTDILKQLEKHRDTLIATAVLVLTVSALLIMANGSMYIGPSTAAGQCKAALANQIDAENDKEVSGSIWIPAICFDPDTGEPVIDELSGAEPGDNVSIIKNKSLEELKEADYDIVKAAEE